jgi:hypothetical protein
MYALSKDGSVPTPKSAKTTTTTGGMTLIIPRELEREPRYTLPDTAPYRRPILPATEIVVNWRSWIDYLPDPTQDGKKNPGLSGQLFLFGEGGVPATVTEKPGPVPSPYPAPGPYGSPLVPAMPAPTPPSIETPPATSSSEIDPNTRMQQLLDKSKDEQRKDTLRQFFFPRQDPPSHLTPERIHGGIIRVLPKQSEARPVAAALRP